MNPTKLVLAALLQLVLITFVSGQTVAITGKITDVNGKNVYGAAVKLKKLNLTTTTDTAGNYAFNVSRAGGVQPSPAYAKPFFSGNFLTFTVAKNNDPVSIETFDSRGRCVCAIRERAMAAGTYKTIPFPAGFSSQMYFCRVAIGNTVSRLMKSPLIAFSGRASFGAPKVSLAKIAASVDTLLISRSGYVYTKYPIDAYTGIYNVSLNVAVSVSFDLDYYQGVSDPLTITAKDPYATAATVDAIVSSVLYPAPDTVKLTKVAGNPGAYQRQMYFKVRPPVSFTDTIRVKDNDSMTVSYRATSPLTTVTTAKAVWMALQPSVRPIVSIYLGLRLPIKISADDRNITDTSITIHLASKKDTVGFNVVLFAVPGSPGSFLGSVQPSLTQSTPGTVLAVRPPIDTLKTIYQSPATNTPVISDALQGTALLWKCNPVSILPDSFGTGYHGTTSKMNINLENDHVVAGSVNIKVKSKKDPTGISVPLAVSADTSFIFTGSVGFTLQASSAGAKTISVAGSDTVTITYYDAMLADTASTSVSWAP